MIRTRSGDEHLAWCKKRALRLLDAGELLEAVTSMASDLSKHEETKIVSATLLGLEERAFMDAAEGNTDGARRFIEGFN